MDHSSAMRRLYELINSGDIDGFGDLLAEDFVEHSAAPGLEPSREGVKQLFRTLRATFPDLQMDVEEVLPSGDAVVARIRVTGTHEGDGFMGLPATGKSVEVPLIDITRFGDDGIAREHWGSSTRWACCSSSASFPNRPRPRPRHRRSGCAVPWASRRGTCAPLACRPSAIDLAQQEPPARE